MAKAIIPLAKGFDPSKLEFPAYLSTKYDGVPVKITVCRHVRHIQGEVFYSISGESRQGENLKSTSNDLADFLQMLIDNGLVRDDPQVFVAEVTHRTLKNFKDISGVVRRQEPQEGLIYNFFDYDDGTVGPFSERTVELENTLYDINRLHPDDRFRYVQQHKVFDHDDFCVGIARLQDLQPDAEGHVARSGSATFKPNSRHWDYQKIVVDPTADLRILRFEEALAKKDENGYRKPLGMVGRVIADYKGNEIGVGPGKLSHKEREQLWREQVRYGTIQDRNYAFNSIPDIATVQYKRDDSYEALRQPTFQHWRPEKTEPSYD